MHVVLGLTFSLISPDRRSPVSGKDNASVQRSWKQETLAESSFQFADCCLARVSIDKVTLVPVSFWLDADMGRVDAQLLPLSIFVTKYTSSSSQDKTAQNVAL